MLCFITKKYLDSINLSKSPYKVIIQWKQAIEIMFLDNYSLKFLSVLANEREQKICTVWLYNFYFQAIHLVSWYTLKYYVRNFREDRIINWFSSPNKFSLE